MSLEIEYVPFDVNPALIRVLVLGHKFGDFTITIGGASTEFHGAGGYTFEHAYIDGDFTYRGRVYYGRIMLKRDTLSIAPGYAWELRNVDNTPVTPQVFKAVSTEILGATLDVLRDHPEIYVKAEYASLTDAARRAERANSDAWNAYTAANQRAIQAVSEVVEYQADHKEFLA